MVDKLLLSAEDKQLQPEGRGHVCLEKTADLRVSDLLVFFAREVASVVKRLVKPAACCSLSLTSTLFFSTCFSVFNAVSFP